MPQSKIVQNAFNAGVLDPELLGRGELEQYQRGVKRGINVLPQVRGGMTRRPGLKYLATVDDDGAIYPFTFSTTQTYLVYFGDDRTIKIYKDGVLQKNLTSGDGVPNWSNVLTLGITQSADTMIICDEDTAPQALVRGATDTDWTLSALSLLNIPQVDFNDSDSPTATSNIQTLTIAGTPANGDKFQVELGTTNVRTADIIYSTDGTTTAARVENALKDAVRNISKGRTGADVTVTGTGPFTVTIANQDTENWGLFTGIIVTGTGTYDFVQNTPGVTRREDVWSATRGWPRRAAFFEGRLWFGGSKSKPTSIWASRTNDFFNFDVGSAFDDEAIFAVLDDDHVNAVTALSPGRVLMIFTSASEHAVGPKGVTPSNIVAPEQTEYGARMIKPVRLDGSAVFIQTEGKQVLRTKFNFLEEAQDVESLSLLASHLLNDPKDMDAIKGTSADDGNYIYVVNGDGTVAVFLTQRTNDVSAWAQWTTAGLFKSVAVVEDIVYFLVRRIIDGSTAWYIEELNTGYFTDSGEIVTLSVPGTSITGLDHLDNETVKLRCDGASTLPDATVSGTGTLTLDRECTTVEAGKGYTATIELLPPTPNFASQDFLDKKRVISLDLLVKDTLAINIDGDVIPDRQTDIDDLDTPPPPFTGIIHHEPSTSEFERDPTNTITQDAPQPMTILAVAREIETDVR